MNQHWRDGFEAGARAMRERVLGLQRGVMLPETPDGTYCQGYFSEDVRALPLPEPESIAHKRRLERERGAWSGFLCECGAEWDEVNDRCDRAESTASTPKTAWLIESKFSYGDGRPRWWMGTNHPAPWTADSLQAVRFCRREDAEAAAATLPDSHMVFVSEHQWGFGAAHTQTEEKPKQLWVCNKCGYAGKKGPLHSGCNYHAAFVPARPER